MRQICAHLDALTSPQMRTGIELAIDTGRRPEEIATRRFDCLARDADRSPPPRPRRSSRPPVARRCGASKATIYRRWPGKTTLVVAAAAALFVAPDVPDTGDLREDLLACGRAYVHREGRTAQVLAAVLTASQHDPALREAARDALGAPYSGLFEIVLSRAVNRGSVHQSADVETLAEVFPAIVYQRVAATRPVRRLAAFSCSAWPGSARNGRAGFARPPRPHRSQPDGERSAR